LEKVEDACVSTVKVELNIQQKEISSFACQALWASYMFVTSHEEGMTPLMSEVIYLAL